VTAPTRSASSAAKTAPTTMAETASVRGDSERHLLSRLTIDGGAPVASHPEELDPPSYRVRRALRSVPARPLPRHQPPADRDLPSLRQVRGAGLGALAERRHVDVGRLGLLAAAAGLSTAIRSSQTERPPSISFNSGSRVRRPIRLTLFIFFLLCPPRSRRGSD
jgi:hypothetical protein